MSDWGDDAGAQDIEPNTWTPLLGTDAEILLDGIHEPVLAEAETLRKSDGEVVVQFTFIVNGAHVALRAPAAEL